MKKTFIIFIGFMHDFAAGCWAATVLAVWWLEVSQEEAALETLQELQGEFFYIGIVCIALVVLAGAGRTFTYAYIGDVYGRESEGLRRKMLIGKHITLFLVFGIGTYWQWKMAFG